jgi:hypothetical protein
MKVAQNHRLVGLEPDNLLAFLALLGLLRSLDLARPDWRARALWDIRERPLRPVLVLASPQAQADIATATAEGIAALATAHQFDRRDLNHPLDDVQKLLGARTSPATQEVLDSLMSDGALRDNKTIRPTPFCLLFGQGHQHFLSRLADIPAGRLPAKLAKLRPPPDLKSPDFINAAVFAPWTRSDPTDGFRWDPAEDRRYALRANDPSGDPAGMQHGANRLAAVGLPALPGTVVVRRGETRFLNVATSYGKDGKIQITWPIWNAPARLHGIRALLAHPALAQGADEIRKLKSLGVLFAFRAERMSVGQFLNISQAQRIG